MLVDANVLPSQFIGAPNISFGTFGTTGTNYNGAAAYYNYTYYIAQTATNIIYRVTVSPYTPFVGQSIISVSALNFTLGAGTIRCNDMMIDRVTKNIIIMAQVGSNTFFITADPDTMAVIKQVRLSPNNFTQLAQGTNNEIIALENTTNAVLYTTLSYYSLVATGYPPAINRTD